MTVITYLGTDMEACYESTGQEFLFHNAVTGIHYPEWNVKPRRSKKHGLIWVGNDPMWKFAFKYDEPPILVQELYAAQHFWNKKKRRKK